VGKGGGKISEDDAPALLVVTRCEEARDVTSRQEGKVAENLRQRQRRMGEDENNARNGIGKFGKADLVVRDRTPTDSASECHSPDSHSSRNENELTLTIPGEGKNKRVV